MKCPKCDANIGQTVDVEVSPLIVRFQSGFNASGKLTRVSEISAEEVVNIDHYAAATHKIVCPSCSETISPTDLVFVPTCSFCGKEKSQMTAALNTCVYRGLVCVECATSYKRNCVNCDYLKTCKLGQRATAKV